MGEWGILLGLAFLVGMDGTALGQFMLSRPLITGVLAGAATGDVGLGAAVGALVELYHLPAIPVGGGRYPEPGPATVVGVFAAQLAGGTGMAAAAPGAGALASVLQLNPAGAVPLGVFFALAFSLLGGWLQEASRAWTPRWLPDARTTRVRRRLQLAQWGGVLLAGVRGLVIAALGMAIAQGLVPNLEPWPLSHRATWLLLLLAGCLPLGSLLAVLGGVRRLGAWAAGGLVIGLIVGVVA